MIEIKIKHTHIIVAALLVLSAALAYNAFTSYINPYLTVSQLVGNSSTYLNKDIQIVGTVANGSTHWGEDGSLLFDLTDGESTINVAYKGSPPQNFKEGEEVVVIGKLISLQTVKSSQMLVKCPSKYEGGGSSLLGDPIFLTAMVLGLAAIAYFVVATARKRKPS